MPKNELYHHGIKGQRWGKRNGPPYPLNAQTHGAIVRSADREGSTGSKSFKKKRHASMPPAMSNKSTKGRIGGFVDNVKTRYNNLTDEERARLRKRVLIGAGVAAGVAGGSLIGRKIYANRARQAASLVEQARANHANIQATHDITTDALNKRSKDLNRIRSSLVNDRLQNQANSLELAKSKSNGLSSMIKRRRINKNIDRIDKKLLENTKQREDALNSWKASKATVDAAGQGVNNAKNAANVLKRRGLRSGIATALGFGAAGGYAGYRANTGLEINDYVNKNTKKRRRR